MKYLLPTALIISGALVLYLLFAPNPFGARPANAPATRVITPQTVARERDQTASDSAERMAFDDQSAAKVSLEQDETLVSVLTQDFDGDAQDEQLLALRIGPDGDKPIFLTYVDFDEQSGGYRRIWKSEAGSTRSRTFSMFSKDLLGNRSVCIIATGMNESSEQTITVFRLRTLSEMAIAAPGTSLLVKIADLRTDGSIVVLEKSRSQAYQLGLSDGESFQIATYGRDQESANILDQIETRYTYDPATDRYERSGTARIPGTQIEQRKVREILDGTPAKFESFLKGLWYFVPASGSQDKQYLHFNPERRELIFYADNTQEVFSWVTSNSTHYGLYISSQNISVTTLRRMIDIELTSAETIRVKVYEAVNLKIGVTNRWDGTYRKLLSPAQSASFNSENESERIVLQNRQYEGARGRLSLAPDGTYTMLLDAIESSGVYALFTVDGVEILELQSRSEAAQEISDYQVSRKTIRKDGKDYEELTLKRVRLGIRGFMELMEPEITLSAPVVTRN